jgi:hypothetical protein
MPHTDRTFTKEEVFDLLISLDQVIDPSKYETSKNLETIDFFDLPFIKAKKLGLLPVI